MHEIITLQLGQRSNYLATHFWNTQESYFTYSPEQESLIDHDIHFRPGIGVDGTETFTPRTLIYDLKGGFGSLKKLNALYEIEEPVATEGIWNGPTVIQRQPTIPQNNYLKSLDEGLEPPPLTTNSVRYWSDFNRVYFHPKSIIQLNEYELNSSIMPFENWDAGEDLFKSLDKEHDLLDRDLRPFIEEADQMQGIQLLTGVDDAWGGFAARYMDRLKDEYGKTTIWFWGIEDNTIATSRAKKLLRLSNIARSISEVAPQASLFIPLAIPPLAKLPSYVTINVQSQWHVSALLSTAVESMTLPSRLKARSRTLQRLDQFENALNINGSQNIAKLRMSIKHKLVANDPDQSTGQGIRAESGDTRLRSQQRNSFESRSADEDLTVLDMDFFSVDEPQQSRARGAFKKTHVFGQAENYRGDEQPKDQAAEDEDEGYIRARQRATGLTLVHKLRTPLPFPILDSFPHIFSQTGQFPATVSVGTSLSTDTSVALRIKSLREIVNTSVGITERETLSNSLGELAEAYEEGWDSGSDEDDD